MSTGLGVCGIDLIRGKNGYPYLIEINSNMGFKAQRITGVNISDKIIAFAERKQTTKPLDLDSYKSLATQVYQDHNQKLNRQLKSFLQNQTIAQCLKNLRAEH